MSTSTLLLMTRAVANNVNQPGGRQFSDGEIKEFINRALGAIQMGLQSHGVRDIRAEATITLPALATALTATSTPPLPSGFAQPIRLWEKNGDVWIAMQQVNDHLPQNAVQGERLVWWEWRDQAIRFSGATQPVQVKIHYRAYVSDVAYPSETIPLSNLTETVIAKASAIAAAISS